MKHLVNIYLKLLSVEMVEEAGQCPVTGIINQRIPWQKESPSWNSVYVYYVLESENYSSFLREYQQ